MFAIAIYLHSFFKCVFSDHSAHLNASPKERNDPFASHVIQSSSQLAEGRWFL